MLSPGQRTHTRAQLLFHVALVAACLLTSARVSAERHVSVGTDHTCRVTETQDVACTGDNTAGKAAIQAGPFHGVSSGANFTCGLFTNGTGVCWSVLTGHTSGNTLRDPAGGAIRFLDLAAGSRHVCGNAPSGAVSCYGDNTRGECTPPSGVLFQGISAGDGYTCGVTRAGSVMCWGDANSPVRAAGAVPTGTGFAEVACGSTHACALRIDGNMSCWGDNRGFAATPPPVPPPGGYSWVSAGANITCAIATIGRAVSCWGTSDAGTPFPANTLSAAEVSCGGSVCWSVRQSDNELEYKGWRVSNMPVVGGSTWTQQPISGVRSWRALASSADGTKLVAAASGAYLYTSVDSGATWAQRDSIRSWFAVASSANGTKLVAAVFSGYMYTSVDSGITWTQRTTDAVRNWRSIASSADGIKLVACASEDLLYTSVDSGVSWTPRDSSCNWQSVASSADGTKLIAANPGLNVDAGYLYVSTNSGVSWTASGTLRFWSAVASSADGTKLVAVVGTSGSTGLLYTSVNGGATWTQRDSQRTWGCVASSADGTKLVAGVNPGYLYTSLDSGISWMQRESSQAWKAVASSADGGNLVAAAYGGYVYSQSAGRASSCNSPPSTCAGGEAVTTWRQLSLGSPCNNGTATLSNTTFIAPLTAATMSGWNPALTSVDMRGAHVTAIEAGTFASPVLFTLQTMWLSPNSCGRLRVYNGTFTGLSSLSRINSAAVGSADLSGLGLYSMTPGTLSLDVLRGLTSIIEVTLVNNNISTFIAPSGTWRHPAITTLALCKGNPGVPMSFTTPGMFVPSHPCEWCQRAPQPRFPSTPHQVQPWTCESVV